MAPFVAFALLAIAGVVSAQRLLPHPKAAAMFLDGVPASRMADVVRANIAAAMKAREGVAVEVLSRANVKLASTAYATEARKSEPKTFKEQLEDLRSGLSADEVWNNGRDRDHGGNHDRERGHGDGDNHDRDRDHGDGHEDDHDRSAVREEESPAAKSVKDQLAGLGKGGLANLGKKLKAGAAKAGDGGHLAAKAKARGNLAAKAKPGGNLSPELEAATAKAAAAGAAEGRRQWAQAEAATAAKAAPPAVTASSSGSGILVEASCKAKLQVCTGMCIHGPIGQLECIMGVKTPYVTSAITDAAFVEPTIVRGKTCVSLGFSVETPDTLSTPDGGRWSTKGGSNVSTFFSPGWGQTLVVKIAKHPPAMAAIKDGWLNALRRASVMCD